MRQGVSDLGLDTQSKPSKSDNCTNIPLLPRMVTTTHQLFVRGAQTVVYDCLPDDNVADLKRRIEERTGISKAHQILAVGSKILDDRASLQKISARNATLRLSMRLRGGRDDEHPWSFMDADPLYAPAELPL